MNCSLMMMVLAHSPVITNHYTRVHCIPKLAQHRLHNVSFRMQGCCVVHYITYFTAHCILHTACYTTLHCILLHPSGCSIPSYTSSTYCIVYTQFCMLQCCTAHCTAAAAQWLPRTVITNHFHSKNSCEAALCRTTLPDQMI